MNGITTGRTYWVVIGGTTLLWMAHLVGMAVATEAECGGAGPAVLHWLTVGLFVPTAVLAVVAWRRDRTGEDEGFLARLAVMTAAANAFLIAAEWAPVLVLTACGA